MSTIRLLEGTSGYLYLVNNSGNFIGYEVGGRITPEIGHNRYEIEYNNPGLSSSFGLRYKNSGVGSMGSVVNYDGSTLPSEGLPTQVRVFARTITYYSGGAFDLVSHSFSPVSAGGNFESEPGATTFFLNVLPMKVPVISSVVPDMVVADGGDKIISINLRDPQHISNNLLLTATWTPSNAFTAPSGQPAPVITPKYTDAQGRAISGWELRVACPVQAAVNVDLYATVRSSSLTYLNGSEFTTEANKVFVNNLKVATLSVSSGETSGPEVSEVSVLPFTGTQYTPSGNAAEPFTVGGFSGVVTGGYARVHAKVRSRSNDLPAEAGALTLFLWGNKDSSTIPVVTTGYALNKVNVSAVATEIDPQNGFLYYYRYWDWVTLVGQATVPSYQVKVVARDMSMNFTTFTDQTIYFNSDCSGTANAECLMYYPSSPDSYYSGSLSNVTAMNNALAAVPGPDQVVFEVSEFLNVRGNIWLTAQQNGITLPYSTYIPFVQSSPCAVDKVELWVDGTLHATGYQSNIVEPPGGQGRFGFGIPVSLESSAFLEGTHKIHFRLYGDRLTAAGTSYFESPEYNWVVRAVGGGGGRPPLTTS